MTSHNYSNSNSNSKNLPAPKPSKMMGANNQNPHKTISEKPVSTRQLLYAVKQTEQDFEWYPTTTEIMAAINNDINKHYPRDTPSILDCGAGDGRVLNALSTGKKYAIEKSRPLLNALDENIFIVGTEFHQQTLIDKKVDVVFSNPPYSEFDGWATKIISEANASYVYLVIPERWRKSETIHDALKARDAKTRVIGQFDFLDADRAARAKVEVVAIDLCYQGEYNRTHPIVDPFKLWFKKYFKLDIEKTESSQYDYAKRSRETIQEEIAQSLVQGDNLIPVLDKLYQRDLAKLINTYQQLGTIDSLLLKEMDVNLEGVRGALQQKIEGLKDRYWKELFNRLDQVTDRLTARSREQLLATLTAHTHVDFSASNAYAIVIWVIKNANGYFDSQLITTVETLTEKANIHLYKSNQKTFGDEQWRYCRQPDGLDRYQLDYRIVLGRVGGLCTAAYSYKQSKNGLSKRASNFLNDLCTIAANIGFDTTQHGGVESFHWDTHIKNELLYHDPLTDQAAVLLEAKAFKNGNLHIKFNQDFICRLNVEFGRLKGWIKSPKEAAEELDISFEQASKSFRSNRQLENSALLQLGLDSAD